MKINNKEDHNKLFKQIEDGEVLGGEEDNKLKDVDEDLINMYNDFDR
jgi:hypothetical protein